MTHDFGIKFRATHIHMNHLNKLVKLDLVVGLPKIMFVKDKLCDACLNMAFIFQIEPSKFNDAFMLV